MGNLVSSVERDESGVARKITFAWGMAEIVVVPGPKVVAILYWVARELVPQWVMAKIMKQAAAIFAESRKDQGVQIEAGDTVYHGPSGEIYPQITGKFGGAGVKTKIRIKGVRP